MVKDILDINGEIIAKVINLKEFTSTQFVSKESDSLQFGFGFIEKDKEFSKHIHLRKERTIDNVAEFIFIIKGQAYIEIINEDGVCLDNCRLEKEMALLQFYGGHAISMVEGTKYFELKQGPYLGKKNDKIEL